MAGKKEFDPRKDHEPGLIVDRLPDPDWPPQSAPERSILINFVLDKSGSMETIRSATISGFNEFKNDQAREAGRAVMTLTLFDTGFHTVATAVRVGDVLDLTGKSYAPDGCTALYDAVGHTMRLTDEYVAKNHPDQVLFVIMTDGQENSSREFSRDKIFRLIEDRQRDAGYEFVYLGANQDSYLAGQQMGINPGRMLDYDADPASARAVLTRASTNVRAHRRHGVAQEPEWFTADFEAMADLEGAALEAQKVKYVRGAAKK